MAGKSYREILQVVGVVKGTLSLWLRDVPLTEEQQRAQITELSESEPFVAGVVAYRADRTPEQRDELADRGMVPGDGSDSRYRGRALGGGVIGAHRVL